MKKGAWWPIAMSMVLATVVVTNIWVAVIAGRDPSFSIEPNYYQKAVAWDSALAQRGRNVELAWTLVPTLSAYSRSGGATLSVRLTDSTGAPVPGARVQVFALYNARASTVHTATLVGATDGSYGTTLPVDHAGQWELRFDVTRGADRFTATTRVEAVPTGAP